MGYVLVEGCGWSGGRHAGDDPLLMIINIFTKNETTLFK